ncbi:unnamed protein product, partial [Ectocarpus sp. 13 AM-2016]
WLLRRVRGDRRGAIGWAHSSREGMYTCVDYLAIFIRRGEACDVAPNWTRLKCGFGCPSMTFHVMHRLKKEKPCKDAPDSTHKISVVKNETGKKVDLVFVQGKIVRKSTSTGMGTL